MAYATKHPGPLSDEELSALCKAANAVKNELRDRRKAASGAPVFGNGNPLRGLCLEADRLSEMWDTSMAEAKGRGLAPWEAASGEQVKQAMAKLGRLRDSTNRLRGIVNKTMEDKDNECEKQKQDW
jgi:hypothetical protein